MEMTDMGKLLASVTGSALVKLIARWWERRKWSNGGYTR